MSSENLQTEKNEENLHLHLTEDSIRHVALRFLKTYYKYRPRKGETTVGKNLSTKAGLIVDGYLSFETEGGDVFLATLEASSYSKRGEVNYTLQRSILFWDALAFGSLTGLLLFSYGYAYNHFTVKQIGLWGSIGVLLGTIALVFLLFRLVSKGFSRYRYIYAVEQFKRYSANEQWIAIGEDVFSNPNDKRLAELKNQCVYNGFGLFMVDKDFEPHLMITPARKAVVKNRPQVFKMLNTDRLNTVLNKTPLRKLSPKFGAFFAKIKGKSPVNTENLMRYRRKFWRQAAAVFLSFGLLSTIMYRELKDADIIHVDTKVYQEEMEKIAINSRPESDKYIIDTIALEEMKEKEDISSSDKSYQDFEDDKITGGEEEDEAAKLIIPKRKNIKTEEVAVYFDGKFIYYDCTRFFGFKGQKYVVTDGLFSTLKSAEYRIKRLGKHSIKAHAFWLGCFDKAEGYIVYYDQIYNKKITAEKAVQAFGVQFKRQKLKKGDLEIMVLDR